MAWSGSTPTANGATGRATWGAPWRRIPGGPLRPSRRCSNRPSFELAQWDRLTARRPVVGLAAHDAHARLGLRGVGEPYDGAVALKVPAYAPMFAAFSNVVRLAQPLSGDAAVDAVAVVRAIAAGHVYAVVTGVAPSGRVRFVADSGGQRAGMGDHLVPTGPVAVVFDADVPPGARTILVCDGRPVAESAGSQLSLDVAQWQRGRLPGRGRARGRCGPGAVARDQSDLRAAGAEPRRRRAPLAPSQLVLAARWERRPRRSGRTELAPGVRGQGRAGGWSSAPHRVHVAVRRQLPGSTPRCASIRGPRWPASTGSSCGRGRPADAGLGAAAHAARRRAALGPVGLSRPDAARDRHCRSARCCRSTARARATSRCADVTALLMVADTVHARAGRCRHASPSTSSGWRAEAADGVSNATCGR